MYSMCCVSERTHVMLLLLRLTLAFAGSSWRRVASMPDGRLNHCVVGRRTTVYSIGGYNFPPPSYEDTLLYLDTTANVWMYSSNNMSTSRDSFACAAHGDAIYAIGGESANYPFTLASVERLNVSEDAAGAARGWELAPTLLQPRQGHSAAVVGDTLFAAGGICANGTVLASVERLGPHADRWETVPPMQLERYYFAVAAVDQTLYAFGGLGKGHAASGPLASAEAFDVQHAVWRSLAPLPEARERMAVAVSDGNIFLLGGCTTSTSPTGDPCDSTLSSVLRFQPPSASTGHSALGTWSTIPSLPQPNAWLGATALSGTIYAVGGGLTYGRNDTFSFSLVRTVMR